MDKTFLPVLVTAFTLAFLTGKAAPVKSPLPPTGKQIPIALESWRDWATWDANTAPPTYHDEKQRISFWPARLSLTADTKGAQFDISVEVFHEDWMALPGGDKTWPVQVKANGAAVPVVLHNNHPSIRLAAGKWKVTGAFEWAEIPQQLAIPAEIGMIALTVAEKTVDFPVWDGEGKVWLRRDQVSSEAEKDFLAIKVYRLIADGIPMWLQTEVELIVSGKSREVDLGGVLPLGWQLDSVKSPLPSIIDDAGRLKVQVRPGKWIIRMQAFRLNTPKEIAYAPEVKPATPEELIAFQAKPDFRLVEVTGIPAVDVSQTTFPTQWRSFPVYRWETKAPFTLVERQRGMGLQKPEGLKINRQLWLDESGKAFTFRDSIAGNRQEIWRLDASAGQQLGAVRSNGEGQLVTYNPTTHTTGVEIRTRNLNLEAVGRMSRMKELPATGWLTDADSLNIALMLPPGWRLFALFGADGVSGDWLTSWSLLDLFLLLIFSLAVFRLWGPLPGIIAFFAFGLSYHEVGAPRYIWLALLVPLALLCVVPAGWGQQLVRAWKWITVLVFLYLLIPFLGRQVQVMLYPQLERPNAELPVSMTAGNISSMEGTKVETTAVATSAAQNVDGYFDRTRSLRTDSPEFTMRNLEMPMSTYSTGWGKGFGSASATGLRQQQLNSNMIYDAKVRIQTGPGVPDWSWRTAYITWNGPVEASQQIRAILIPPGVERALTLLRVVLLLALAAVLLQVNQVRGFFGASRRMAAATAMLALLLLLPVGNARAQFPDDSLLNTLKDRILATPDAFPNAAAISTASLQLRDRKITLDTEIHAAVACGVPLPGRLPTWSPLTATLDGQPATALLRRDGFLWIVVPEGVHHVRIEGMLSSASDWEWAFQLKPHHVTVDAPDWNVSGINRDGVPESQVFFAVKQKSTESKASYDRQDLQSLAIVQRNVEIGLVWQVHTTVRRVSPNGKAIELRIPLLPGEHVLTSNLLTENNRVEVRLGANDNELSWESELPVTEALTLKTNAADTWVEQWQLAASPVWNLTFSGIAPVFEQSVPNLVPVWHPWPGEETTWTISRPEAVKGETVTVDNVSHRIAIGSRQRTSQLTLGIRSSLGEDFAIALPENAEITSLNQAGKAIPVRMEKGSVIFPLHPGAQTIDLYWKTNVPMGACVHTDSVRLPVESANVNTSMEVPNDRWVLWTHGPLRGPAVQFWVILICAIVAGWVLGRLRLSPLSPFAWMLLAIGLTQVPLTAALFVAGWLFLLMWRGMDSFQHLSNWLYNLLQIAIIVATLITLSIFIGVVSNGLLGNPEMFILGNGSTRTSLQWYQDRCATALSQPGYVAISIWWYRFLMLAWALWLAASLLRWLHWGWRQFITGGAVHRRVKIAVPPVVPPVK